jgi:hypothetical protein
MAVGSASAFALLLVLLWPSARSAGEVLLSRDDPSRLSDLRLGFALRNDPALLEQNIVAALEAGDSDLARSFFDLATARGIVVAPAVAERVAVATADERAPSGVAKKFITGFVTGEVSDGASLSGTVAGDLFVFGDIRDVVREGKRLATGEEADRLVLGLATVGLAVTAATYVSAGGAAPVRAGLTMVKDARKIGRLGAGLTEWAGRSARAVVDGPTLRAAVSNASLTHPRQTVTALKAAFKAEKAGALVRLAKDVGRVGEKAGTRGALDVLRIADGPKDVARAARLAEKKGSQTRAIIKILGRGALLFTAWAFNLAWWVFGALLTMFGFVASIKAVTERATMALLQHRKRTRLARQLALTSTQSA